MATNISKKIEANKARAASALTRKDKQAGREEVKRLASVHAAAAIKKLGDLISDKTVPASAKVAAASQLLDRVAGKPVKDDQQETEKTQLERMSDTDTLQYICDNISGLSTQARAVIAQTLIGVEKGFAVNVKHVLDENFSESEALRAEDAPQGLPPLMRVPKPKKEPRR